MRFCFRYILHRRSRCQAWNWCK